MQERVRISIQWEHNGKGDQCQLKLGIRRITSNGLEVSTYPFDYNPLDLRVRGEYEHLHKTHGALISHQYANTHPPPPIDSQSQKDNSKRYDRQGSHSH